MGSNWTDEIQSLEAYFKSVYTPHSIVLSRYETITDVDLFIESHLHVLRVHNGKPWFIPYLDRLKDLKRFMENNCETLKPFPIKPGNNKPLINI